jgi:hypothetical protein
MVGEVLNFAQAKWGEKYTEALNQTGRASDTLRYCASISALIPPNQREWIGPLNLEDSSGDGGDWWKQSRYSLH